MTGFELVLERKDQPNDTPTFGAEGGSTISLTPPVGEDYWLFRVKVSESQAILGFPKFSTIGIGFAVEEDWNTNFPFWCPTEETWEHIRHNKGEDAIPDQRCIEAIRMVRDAAGGHLGATRCAECGDWLSGSAVKRYERFCSRACEAGGVSSQ